MNHLLVFRGLLRSTLFVASILPGQDRHDPLRVLRTMEVEGLAAFDRDRIAGALIVDGTLLRELQRPLDDEAATAIAARVQELHRLGGYLQAKAQADVAAGVVTVQLAAGPRSSCGPARIDGNSVVPSARLREALAARTDDKAAWTEGAFPTAAADVVQRRAVAVVTAVYRDLGRHGVRVQAEVGPEEGALVLRVRITDEGREVRVQRLALDGDDDAAKDVLAGVSFAPGALADTAWLVATQRQIERSGRYFDVRPVLVDPLPATLELLVFAVKLRPNAPTPGTLAPADVAQLQAMFDTVLADLRTGRLLELNTELRDDDVPSWLRVLPGPVAIAFGDRGVRLSAARTGWTEGAPGPAAVKLAADALTVTIGERSEQWRFGRAAGVQIQVSTTFAASGEAEFRWGIGLGTANGDLIAAKVHPATAAHLLTRATSIRRDGDELVVEFPLTTLRIGADGRLRGDSLAIALPDRELTIAWSSERLDRPNPGAVDALRGATPVVLMCNCIARLLQAFVATDAEPRVRAAVHAAVDALTSLPTVAAPASATVERPLLAASPLTIQGMLAAVANQLVVDRSYHGELVAVAAAIAALLRGDGTAAPQLQALAESDTAGPLVLGAMAQLLGLAGNERAAAVFRDRALGRCTFAAAWRDAADLARNVPSLAGLPSHIGAAWRRVPELQELLAGLPAGGEGDVMAWQRGLELLWQHGGEGALRALLER